MIKAGIDGFYDLPTAAAYPSSVQPGVSDSDSQCSGRTLRDASGAPLVVGQRYLLMRCGHPAYTVDLFEDPDTFDLCFNLASDPSAVQRVEELAEDVILVRG